jgi:hypothetical protein
MTNRRPKGTPTGGQFAPGARAEVDVDLDDGWEGVGVVDPSEIERLSKAGVEPSDFESRDMGRRMWACAMRGDLVFEGRLLSNATELWRHDDGIDRGRIFHTPAAVKINGADVPWGVLDAEEQCDYISGYAAAIGGSTDHKDNRFARAGYRRGLHVDDTERAIASGDGPRQLTIIDSDASHRRLRVEGVVPSPRGRGYIGQIAAGQYRQHYDFDGSGRVVPYGKGTRVFFEVDAIDLD